MNKNGIVLGVGAANVDVSGAIRNDTSMRDSNPGSVILNVGGVTHNMLINYVMMGGRAALITSVGDDSFASIIEDDLTRTGIDISRIIRVPRSSSAIYLAVLDNTGDMLIGVNALETHRNTTPESLRERHDLLEKAELIICDTSIPRETLEYLAYHAGKPLFVDPVSIAHSRRLEGIVGAFHTVTPNLIELEAMANVKVNGDRDLERAADVLLKQGTQRIIVTLGRDGCFYKDRDGITLRRRMKPVEKMENATGAGDAFMAGVIYGTMQGYGPEATLDTALAAGIAAILSRTTINPNMSEALIEDILKEYSIDT